MAVETEQRVFFRPSEESERRLWQVEMVMVDRWGDVALDANGYPVGYAERLDGGLAIDTAGLEIDEGPFRVMVQSEGEPVGGRIYLCPPGAPDCSEHDVTRDICGGEGACEGEGEVCCLDANGAASCTDTRNDIDNCGGCGRTCEWDEVCLDGVCARGEGISCWETECPDGTYCASDAWLFRTDPSCLALDVDRDNCGWKGHACGEGRECAGGLCLPITGEPCQADCGESRSCCWALGQTACVDTSNDVFNCGQCGHVCPLGSVCDGGACVELLEVWDPCPLGTSNCGGSDTLECVDLASDEENCGRCGGRCTVDADCIDGVCVRVRNLDEGDYED